MSTDELFEAYLHLKKLRLVCRCGGRHFNIENQVLLTTKFELVAGHVSVEHIPTIAAVCADCYAVHLYAREPIERYVMARKS